MLQCGYNMFFLHRVRLLHHTYASIRQGGQQGAGTGAGHIRAAKEMVIRVHTIQVSGAVRGCRDRTVLQSVQVL